MGKMRVLQVYFEALWGSFGGFMENVCIKYYNRGSHHLMFHKDRGGDITLLLLQGQGGLERCQRPGDTGGDTGGMRGHPSNTSKNEETSTVTRVETWK